MLVGLRKAWYVTEACPWVCQRGSWRWDLEDSTWPWHFLLLLCVIATMNQATLLHCALLLWWSGLLSSLPWTEFPKTVSLTKPPSFNFGCPVLYLSVGKPEEYGTKYNTGLQLRKELSLGLVQKKESPGRAAKGKHLQTEQTEYL